MQYTTYTICIVHKILSFANFQKHTSMFILERAHPLLQGVLKVLRILLKPLLRLRGLELSVVGFRASRL